jgi:hypothetical protein
VLCSELTADCCKSVCCNHRNVSNNSESLSLEQERSTVTCYGNICFQNMWRVSVPTFTKRTGQEVLLFDSASWRTVAERAACHAVPRSRVRMNRRLGKPMSLYQCNLSFVPSLPTSRCYKALQFNSQPRQPFHSHTWQSTGSAVPSTAEKPLDPPYLTVTTLTHSNLLAALCQVPLQSH